MSSGDVSLRVKRITPLRALSLDRWHPRFAKGCAVTLLQAQHELPITRRKGYMSIAKEIRHTVLALRRLDI